MLAPFRWLTTPVARHNSVPAVFIDLAVSSEQPPADMRRIVWVLIRTLVSAFRSRRQLVQKNMALRQQLAAFMARGKRPPIRAIDGAFWTLLRRLWARWADALVFVKPDTVVRWHRAGFRLLYVLFVIRHGRRQIAHFNVTEHPTAAWVVQQLREASPYPRGKGRGKALVVPVSRSEPPTLRDSWRPRPESNRRPTV